MELTTNPKVWKILLLILALLTLLFIALFYFQIIFITFVVGGCLILLTQRVMEDFQKRAQRYGWKKERRRMYGYIIMISWIVVIGILSWQSIHDISEVVSQRQYGLVQAYDIYIGPYLPDMISDRITGEVLQDTQRYFIAFLSNFFTNVGSFIAAGILIIPLMFYMYFRRGPHILKSILEVTPKKFHNGLARAAGRTGRQLNDFFTGKLVESVVIASIACFGFYLAGLKGWLILGVLVGFLNIVPYIGPVIGAIPPLIVALFQGGITPALVLLTVIIAQLIDNLYLIPFMLSDKVKMDPLVSIVLVLIGAQLFGVLGMIFAIPIYLVYKIVLQEAYLELVKIYK